MPATTEPPMHDRHLLHEFMTGQSHREFARRDRRMRLLIQIGIGAMVVLAVGQMFI
jgi:hypothetical protein